MAAQQALAGRNTRRGVRLSDAETRALMLTTALEMIEEEGLSVSLDYLSLEDVVRRSGASRTSVYRQWPSKDGFLSDLLVEIAKSNSFRNDVSGMLSEVAQMARTNDFPRTAQGRHDFVIEVLRVTAQHDFDAMSASPRFRTHLAITATQASLHDAAVSSSVTTVLQGTDPVGVRSRAGQYELLSGFFGFRLRPDLGEAVGYQDMALTVTSVMTGLIIASMSDPTIGTTVRPMRAFGSSRVAPWTAATHSLVGSALSYVETAPDSMDDPRERLDDLLAMLRGAPFLEDVGCGQGDDTLSEREPEDRG